MDLDYLKQSTLAIMRRSATNRLSRFERGEQVETMTIDEIVAVARDDIEDDEDPDELEMSLRGAALIIEGRLEQPADPAPGSLAESQAPIVEWLKAAALAAEENAT